MHLHRRVILPLCKARDQRFTPIVFNLRHICTHDALKHRIHTMKHIGARAEVILQINAPCQRIVLAVIQRRTAKEQRRLRLTEAIDTLLDVAYHEHAVFPRKAAHNRFLNRTGILILIDKHVAIAVMQRAANCFAFQRPDCAVLQIVEIHQAPLTLERAIESVICTHQLRKAPQRRGSQRDILRSLLQRRTHRRLQRQNRLFQRIAPCLNLLSQLLIVYVALLFPAEGCKCRLRQRLAKAGIACLRRVYQIAQQTHILRAGRLIMRRAALAPAKRQRQACIAEQLLHLPARILRQHPGSRAYGKLVRAEHARSGSLVQPLPGIRPRHDKAIERARQLGNRLLLIACICRHEIRAARFIAGIQRVLHGLRCEHAALLLITDTECRIDPQRLKMLPEQIAAEPVQRGNARPRKRHGLFAQLRPLSCRPIQCRADPLAHLARRRIGEGDDQHAVDRASLFHQLHDALHQHRRFARACRRTDNEAVSPVRDRVHLFLCPVRHGTFLPRYHASIIAQRQAEVHAFCSSAVQHHATPFILPRSARNSYFFQGIIDK